MSDVMLEQEELPGVSDASTEPANDTGEEWEERPPERNMGALSSELAFRIMWFVGEHVMRHQLGKVFGTDCGYQLPNDAAKKARFPDGSFVPRGRLPDERTPEGNMKLAPDLALEVVSPNDMAYEVEDKRVAYLRAGVRLVWIVYPPTRTFFIFRASGSVDLLTEADTLSGEDVLPGFSCPVSRFFEDL
jgi:Uma2 family endonuclease